ncbi:methylated-DNA--[protein]-cysteine S-methyltransferase [Microvirga sp. 2MCAF38]|uniref:methylated-DNA--[protein]-cysteine S-methyltransferase n=1 Tax=Microvirga sp. 2MCAF38 TaxID=3232989 RepID=UPI003F998685
MAEALRFLIDRTPTPIGELVVIADEQGRLRMLDWTDHEDRFRRFLRLHYGADGFTLEPAKNPGGLTETMNAYFEGDTAVIDELPTATNGTPFQRAVWAALRGIPCGETISYAELARRIDNPKAVRAVGLANGANPIGIVVPCHRVVGTNGSLTGYGGGMMRKRWLLAHESAVSTSSQFTLSF